MSAFGQKRSWHTSVVAKANKPFSQILASVKSGDCTRTVFYPVDDVLSVTKAAIANPPGQSRHSLFVAMLVIENEKAGHARPFYKKVALHPRSGRRRIPAWYRSGATDDDSRAHS